MMKFHPLLCSRSNDRSDCCKTRCWPIVGVVVLPGHLHVPMSTPQSFVLQNIAISIAFHSIRPDTCQWQWSTILRLVNYLPRAHVPKSFDLNFFCLLPFLNVGRSS
eukprot:1369321-Rhodomonas_salina.1